MYLPWLRAEDRQGAVDDVDRRRYAVDRVTLNANNALVKYLFEHKDSEHSGMFAEQLYSPA